MITDSLQHASKYYGLNKWFKASFEFLLSLSPETEDGSYEIAPGVNAFVSMYETMPEFPYGWETHRKYVDIQLCVSGAEHIKCAPLSEALAPTIDYDDEKDRRFYIGNVDHTLINLAKDVFAVFFPQDAHAPQLMIGKPERVKKVVVKVPVE